MSLLRVASIYGRQIYFKKVEIITRLEGFQAFRPGAPALDLFPRKAWGVGIECLPLSIYCNL